jgi:hypothetical protein
MMLLTTSRFLDAQAHNLHVPEGLSTTCLSQYPEMKINRGILKLHSREVLRNGQYKLRYYSMAKPQTFEEVVSSWLQKHGQIGSLNSGKD